MEEKMSIKEVARALDLPLAESNALAKLVPERPGIELKRVLHAPMTAKVGEKSLEEKDGVGPDDLVNVKLIRDIYKGDDIRSRVLHESERLQVSVRSTGLHAADIIVPPDDLSNLLPVCPAR